MIKIIYAVLHHQVLSKNQFFYSVIFNQARFVVDGNNTDLQEAWHIPVSYATLSEFRSSGTSTQPRVWLTKAEKQKTVEKVLPPGAPGSNEWLLVNLEHTGELLNIPKKKNTSHTAAVLFTVNNQIIKYCPLPPKKKPDQG